MNRCCKELKAFMDAIVANPRDVDTRKVFADWLDDNDEPELADEQRNFSLELHDAQQRLRKIADQYADGDYDGMVSGAASGKGYCFSDDNGPYQTTDPQFWADVETVTRKPVSEFCRELTKFYCAC